MRYFVLDASALGKRYVPEPGSAAVTRLIDQARPRQLLCLTLGVGEVISLITRRRNEKRLTAEDALDAVAELNREVLHNPEVTKLPMPDEVVVPGFAYIRRHNLNATDAVLLNPALRVQEELPKRDKVVVVASDARLLRAADAEGLETVDPEQATDEQLALFLAPDPDPMDPDLWSGPLPPAP